MKVKEVLGVVSIPALLASLCCLSPVILVLLGISTVSFGASLADTLYGDYKWLFRAVGFLALLVSVIVYLRRQRGICTLDDARRRRTEIINVVMLAFIGGVLAYLFFLYIVVHYVGVFLGLWT